MDSQNHTLAGFVLDQRRHVETPFAARDNKAAHFVIGITQRIEPAAFDAGFGRELDMDSGDMTAGGPSDVRSEAFFRKGIGRKQVRFQQGPVFVLEHVKLTRLVGQLSRMDVIILIDAGGNANA